MTRKTLIDALGILLLALIVVVGYKLSPLLLPKADVTVEPPAACDLLRAPCDVALPGGGQLHFSITPRPIPALAPLAVEVVLTGRSASKVEVDFAGATMDMGLNRPALTAAGDGRFTGQATLPVCVTGAMDWRATVLMDGDRERIAVPFRFSSGQG